MADQKVKVVIEGENLLSADLRQLESEFVQVEKSGKKTGESISKMFSSLDDEQFSVQAAWQAAMDDVKAATIKTVMAANAEIANLGKNISSDRLAASFKNLNIKSALDIETEKSRLIASFEAIKKSGVASADEIRRAEKALHDQLQKIDGALASNKTAATESTGGIATGLRGVAQWLAAAFAVDRVIEFTKESFHASLAVDAIASKLKVMAGSDQGAADELAFIRVEAKRLGLDLLQTAEAYSSFAVATKGTSIEGAKTKQIFVAMSEAATALHLPAEKAAGVLYQFQQMVSKGKVNLEDLKTASESFPGLMGMVAKSLNITTSELMSQMQAGTLMADDVLPKLAEQLHKTYGTAAVEAANKGRGALNKFNTAVFELKAYFGESTAAGDGLSFITGIVEGLKSMILYAQTGKIYITALVEKFSALTDAGGIVGLMSGGKEARDDLKEQFAAIDAMTERSLKKREEEYKKYSDSSKKAEKDVAAAAKSGLEETAEETARNSQRRRENARKTGEDLAKIEVAYGKEIGSVEEELTAEYAKGYEDRKKAVIDFYNQKKAYANSDIEEAGFEITKNQKLQQIATQHAQDVELIKIRSAQRMLEDSRRNIDLEILYIQEAAAKKQITAFEAERQITAITVAAAQDQYQVKKAAADKARDIYGQDSAEYRARLKDMESAHKAYTSANLAAYKTYSDNIKKLDQEMADFRLSIQQKIADLQQRGMTEGQKYADNQKRFDEAVSKSRSALAAKDYETAQKYAKQAEELASRLADKKTEQNSKLQDLEKQHQERLSAIANKNTGAQTDQQRQASEMAKENADYEKQRLALLAEQKATTEGITNATSALNTVEKLGIDILAAKKQENADALVKLKEIQDFKLDPKNLPVTLDQGALGQVRSQIAALTRDETKTIYIKTVEGRSNGGRVGMSRGGKLPGGDSLIDSIPVLARPGEWFIRNESAKFWGDRVMQAINVPSSNAGQRLQALMSSVQHFNTGGQVQPVDMGSLTINVGSAAFPIQGQTGVLNQLKQELRREQMRRPQ